MKLIIILSVFLSTSCSTIFCGAKRSITVDANLSTTTAKLIIDGETYHNVTFPCKIKVKRGFNTSVIKGDANGYYPAFTDVYKEFNAVSVINLLFWPGWIIDLATGAIMTTEKNYYYLQFYQQ